MPKQPNVPPFLTDEEIYARMRELRRLAFEVKDGLERSDRICSECEHRRPVNWRHEQIADSMRAVITRSEKWIRKLEDGFKTAYTGLGSTDEDRKGDHASEETET